MYDEHLPESFSLTSQVVSYKFTENVFKIVKGNLSVYSRSNKTCNDRLLSTIKLSSTGKCFSLEKNGVFFFHILRQILAPFKNAPGEIN